MSFAHFQILDILFCVLFNNFYIYISPFSLEAIYLIFIFIF